MLVSATCLLVAASLLDVDKLGAQTAGRIVGQVMDASQAPVPGATVSVENTRTGQQRSAVTDGAGRYAVADLPIGAYAVKAGHSGFQTVIREDVVLGVDATVPVDFTLPVGKISEQIEVRGEAAVLPTNGAAIGGTMENRQLVELPINGRDYTRFSMLVPGSVAGSNQIADVSFNGQHIIHNSFSMDGVDATRIDGAYLANGYERGARLLTGSLETISEFRVETNSYQAQYGRAAGSSINIATKAGSNQFHGSLLEFLRNSDVDARNFFANTGAKPAFRFNDFGGNVGGPLVRNKTFFFVNYEGSRQRIGVVGSGTVPSALLTAEVLSTSPALAPIVAMYPVGTSPTSNPLVDNYTTSQVSEVREDTGSVRVDHNFSNHDSVFVRVNVNDTHVFGPEFVTSPNDLGLLDRQNVPIRTSNVAIHEEHIFSPTLLNEFLAGGQRWGSHIITDEPYPAVTVTGFTARPGTSGRTNTNSTSYQVGDGVSWIHGPHIVKFGGDAYRIWENASSIATSKMTYTSITDFINNRISTATLTSAIPMHGIRATQSGGYVQDTYRAAAHLTLDFGIRYDFETAPRDSRNLTQTFDTRTGNLGSPGTPYFNPSKNDWAPRFSLAWQPTSRWVVRAGYGIFQLPGMPFENVKNISQNTIPGNLTLLIQQIPTLSYPFANYASQGTAALHNAYGVNWNRNDVYAEQWNVSVGTQLTASTSLQVAYVGNHGLNLRSDHDINYIDPATGLRPNPLFGDIFVEDNSGQNLYHALQVSFKRRLARGLAAEFEYTYAHAIDDVQDEANGSGQPQNINNLSAERGNGGRDIRHNASYNVLYELPMGQGHGFLGSARGVGGKLASGWSLASLGLVHTGIANSVLIGTSTYGNGDTVNQRPNAVAGVNVYPANQSVNNWLNPAAFSLPAAGSFGNLGRNTIFGPSFAQIDFSALKDTRLTESKTLQFRAEFFNIPNHPNFAQPNTTFGTSTFGRILSTFGNTIGSGTSRQIQFGLKLLF